MTSFTISLEAARVNKKMTQAEMAKALGVHRSTVYNWERGKTSPNYKYLKKIEEITGVPCDYIFLPDTLLKVDSMNSLN